MYSDEKVEQSMREAWEHEDNNDALKIEIHGMERNFWLRTEAGGLR
jgi:hypothetical protein